ncbi:MAG TPA: ROK family protein [Chloroflexota bacterium]|nr:ROK family protein [Chloroflexota bacterium]
MIEQGSRRQVEDVRAGNRALLLAIARQRRTVSRPQLVEYSGLSVATAYGIADELQRTGVLVAAGNGESNGGRRPQLLRFEPNAWFALGVEMGERDLHAVLTDLDGRVLQREDGIAAATVVQEVVETTTACVRRLAALVPAERILGLGFAAPGLVDMASGVVHGAVGYAWRNVPLAALLRDATGLPTDLANRSKAAALGEYYRGAGSGARFLVYLYVGRGIAAGFVQDGALYGGVNSSAGEVGHITVQPDGLLCECGNRGCLHTVASGMALLERARREFDAPDGPGELLRLRAQGDPARLTTVDLAEAARAGDTLATALVRDSGRAIGLAAGTIVNLLNPDRLIIGGPLAAAGPAFFDAVLAELRRHVLTVPYSAVEIRLSTLASDAGSVGAASLALRRAVARLATPG